MTIAATLSRKLYETFGDEAAGAMVHWMQRVDTQRSELRKLGGRIDERLATVKFDILKWSFVFWATTLITLFVRTR